VPTVASAALSSDRELELLEQIRALEAELARLRACAGPTDLERALRPLERAEAELELLGELRGIWRSAPDLARSSSQRVERVRRVLARAAATDEEHPDPLVETRPIRGVTMYRLTGEGEKALDAVVSFDVEDLEGVVRELVAERERGQ